MSQIMLRENLLWVGLMLWLNPFHPSIPWPNLKPSLMVCEKKDRPTGTNLRRTVKTSPQQVRKACKMIDTNDANGRELLLPRVIPFVEHDVTQRNVEHVQWMRRYDRGDPIHEPLQLL